VLQFINSKRVLRLIISVLYNYSEKVSIVQFIKKLIAQYIALARLERIRNTVCLLIIKLFRKKCCNKKTRHNVSATEFASSATLVYQGTNVSII